MEKHGDNEMKQLSNSTSAKSRTYPSDEQKKAIRSVFSALLADYGNAFKNQFDERLTTPNKWMWRLAKELRDCNPSAHAIIDGTEDAILASPDKPPTIPQLVKAITASHKKLLKRDRELREAEEVAKLPPPGRGSVDPIAMIAEASGKIKEAYHSPEKMDALLEAHERLIERGKYSGNIRVPTYHENTLCCVPGCRQIGVYTGSLAGSENWYCRDHWRRS